MIDLKPFTIAPLTGLLDNRSSPDLMPKESFRRIQNFWCPEQNTLSRRPGWTKFRTKEAYNNEDLHDQMLALQTYYNGIPGSTIDTSSIDEWPSAGCGQDKQTRTTGRQPITMLFQSESSTGARKLIAATESRIYAVNELKGTWKMLGDGYGTETTTIPAYRFYAAQSGDTIVFTNNYNLPMTYMFDSKSLGCDMRAVHEIADCELIGLTRAAYVWVWRDVVFFANVEMDGQRYRHRVVWGDYQKPQSLDPSLPESIAGLQDLEYGEEILGGAPMGDYFIIYTSRRIWQIQAVGGDEVFSFVKRYNPTRDHTGEGLLRYRNTLVQVGDSHVYMAEDGIYEYDLYSPAPKRVEWLHLGTGEMYRDLDPTKCDLHIGHFNPNLKEIWFSYVETGENLPSKTLVVNKQFQHVSTIDYGFSAVSMYRPNELSNIRDFAIDNCACTLDEMNTYGYDLVKEGLSLSETAVPCATPITCIYSTTDITIDGATVEDFNQARPSPGSLCEKLLTKKIDDFCQKCPSSKIMVMVSSEDWCLKEIADVAYRETCTNPTDTGTEGANGYTSAVGVYSLIGYDSILNGQPLSFGQPKTTKQVDRLDIQANPVTQLIPSQLQLRVGGSESPVDPILGECAIMWEEQDPINFECLDGTAAENAAAGTRPDEPFAWSLFMVGKYFHWELKIEGTGGLGDFSTITIYPRGRMD